jgi:hypothetical protein
MPILFEGTIVKPRLDLLISPGFVIGLLTLLANDFLLKAAWPGFVTGKLSDFAGLFVFALFWAALFPRDARGLHALTAVLWVLWKSPAAQPAIDLWNASSPYDVARVVDYGDLAALTIVPLSYAYFMRVSDAAPASASNLRSSSAAIAMLVAVFAFGATSKAETPYERPPRDSVWYVDERPSRVGARIDAMDLDYHGKNIEYKTTSFDETHWIAIPVEFCDGYFEAKVEFSGTTTARIDVQDFRHHCDRDADELLAEIERQMILPVGGYKRGETPTGALRDDYGAEFDFDVSRDELGDRMEDEAETLDGEPFEDPPSDDPVIYPFVLGTHVCPSVYIPGTGLEGQYVRVRVELSDLDGDRSTLKLLTIDTLDCEAVEGRHEALLSEFEAFVARLRSP